jgi:hypothetical protein
MREAFCDGQATTAKKLSDGPASFSRRLRGTRTESPAGHGHGILELLREAHLAAEAFVE